MTSPIITNFSIPTKTYGNVHFIIIPPTSTSTGLFSYTYSNLSVATISGDIMMILYCYLYTLEDLKPHPLGKLSL